MTIPRIRDLVAAFDWASTPLGRREDWPASLQTVVELMMDSANVMGLVWGPENIHIYNDAFADQLLPPIWRSTALGRSVFETFRDYSGSFAEEIAEGMAGISRQLRGRCYPVLRTGAVEDAWFNVTYAPLRDDSGAVAGVLWTLTEITKEWLAQEALTESDTRHRLLIESWAQAVWETDPDGVVVADSPSWRAYTGQALDQWLGYGWLGAVHPDDRAYAERQWRNAVASRDLFNAEYRLHCADGSWKWTNVRAAPVIDATGKISKWAGMNIDIDARKRAEAGLRESEERYRLLFESMDEAYAVVEVLKNAEGHWTDFRFLQANSAFVRHTSMPYPVGKTAIELLGTPNPRWTELYGQALDTGKPIRVEEDEETLGRTFDLNIFCLDRELNRVAVLFTDVTDRVEADRALRELQARQSFLLELSDAVRFMRHAHEIQSTTTRLVAEHLKADRSMYAEVQGERGQETGTIQAQFVRQAAERQMPVAPFPEHFTFDPFGAHTMVARYRGEPLVVADVDTDPAFSAAERAAWHQAGIRAAIVAPLPKEGRLVAEFGVHSAVPRDWTDAEVQLIEDVAERTWAVVERARAEAALRESEELQDLLMDNVPALIGFHDRDERYVWINAEYERFFQARREDILGKTLRQWIGEEAYSRHQPYVRRALAGERVSFEDRGLRKATGELGWTEETFIPRFDEVGQVEGFYVLSIDIAERRRAETALRESETRLRVFGDASQDVLWIRDAATMAWTYLTPAFEQVYGLSRQEALEGDDFDNWLELIVPEDRARARGMVNRVIAGEQVSFEYRIRRPRDGQIRWLRNTDFPMRDDQGRVVSFGGIGQDITSSKAAEEALKASEERLRSATEVGKIALWDWNMATDQVAWSDEHYRMEGYAVGEIEPSFETWAARIHPNDRSGTIAALIHARDTQTEYIREFRTVHPNGSVHWLSARGRFFYNEAGMPVRMIGAMLEVTERRNWEDRQRVLVAELQHRTRNLMGVVRSISDRTARASSDIADFRARFRDQLDALSRVQGLLSRLKDHGRVTFDDLIRTELFAMHGSLERITLEGPTGVGLRSSTVQMLAMALHELATNALKYGALGQPSGRLAVRWWLEPSREDRQPWLHVDWRETGVSMPSQPSPQGSGQGRELIEKALPYQLDARTSYRLRADGVHCEISIPVSATTFETVN